MFPLLQYYRWYCASLIMSLWRGSTDIIIQGPTIYRLMSVSPICRRTVIQITMTSCAMLAILGIHDFLWIPLLHFIHPSLAWMAGWCFTIPCLAAYIVMTVFHALWLQDLVKVLASALCWKGPTSPGFGNVINRALLLAADEIVRMFVVPIMSMIASRIGCYAFPIIAMLQSFAAYDAIWGVLNPQRLNDKFIYMESRCIYFTCYGATMAVLLTHLPFFWGAALHALVFPWYMLGVFYARPIDAESCIIPLFRMVFVPLTGAIYYADRVSAYIRST